jgi:acetyl esterase
MDHAEPLHPDMLAWLQRAADLALRYPQSHGASAGMSVADRRLHSRDQIALLAPTLPGMSALPVLSSELRMDLPGRSLTARVLRPQRLASAVLLAYFHGGGWVVGDLDTHDLLCRYIGHQLGCTVVNIDYRRSPEFRAPSLCADAADATTWLHQHLSDFGCTKLAVGGDSAGAHLAAWGAHAQRQALDAVAAMLLLYPVSRHAFDTPSYQQRGAGPGLTTDAMRWYWQQFLPPQAPASRDDPAQDLALLWREHTPPPATVVAAWHDPLCDDATHLSTCLKRRLGRVADYVAADMPHGFARYVGVNLAAQQHVQAALSLFKAQL